MYNEEKCNRYKLLREECLEIHKKMFYGDQQFNNGHTPIEHCCSKEDKKLQGEPKYRDKKGKEYTDIESFRNRTTLQEIEIKERKGHTLSPREEERMIKVRIMSRKEEENQEEVIEIEPHQETTHASND